MKLWISKQTDAPIRDQLVTQLTLALSSGDIAVGEKLPSRGELSRRFGIHENTVSSAYKILSENGLVEFRKGSGFYARSSENTDKGRDLEWLTALYLKDATGLGADYETIRRTVLDQIKRKLADGIVVIEEDQDLRQILMYEISACTGEPVSGLTPNELNKSLPTKGKMVALADEKRKIERSIADCLYLKSRSIPEAMIGRERPADDALIALVSGWDGFLKMAQTILLAVEIAPESIMMRSTQEDGWKNGMGAASMVIADSLAARHFRGDPRLRVFPFLSDESVEDLKRLASES
ncbi:MAG: GntR family transcriptional regulator [Acidobacteriota bacterium]|nr:GntR family transcriptional regulator [Acidobacteriota bacterium]MDH3529420.1 GntR family transcriptional regulator [Acidobacteriota bacterium]